ncbi:MAG: hypothetical protein AB2L14_36150 [Candidatus Xenobiia bacterium LiM19]
MKRCRGGWRKKRNGIRASVLIITLLVSAIIFMIAVSFSTMVTMESKTAQASNDANLALYEADAGLRRAFVELVNMEWVKLKDMIDNGTPFKISGGCFSSSGKSGNYGVKIVFVRELSESERYEVTVVEENSPASGKAGSGNSVSSSEGTSGNIGTDGGGSSTDGGGTDGGGTDGGGATVSKGKYQWRFKMVSVGRIENAGTVLAQRTVIAYVDIQRAQNADEYRGSGNIFYWSEMNR